MKLREKIKAKTEVFRQKKELRILQGQVSNPSERGTPQLFQPMLPEPNNVLALEEIVGARRSYDI